MIEKDKKQIMMENFIFNELKDCKTRVAIIRRKYEGLDIDFGDVYRRIVNYQIKKYGVQLGSTNENIFYDMKKASENARKRRKHRINYEGNIKKDMEMAK